MKIAIGIVAPMVNVPHALSASALTTARPRPASAMTTMKRIAIAPVVPATGPISVRAISASDRPPRRVDAHSVIDVVDRAGEADAGDEPDEPGRVAELRRQHRADERPGAGDRREVMAEEHPRLRRVVVVAVVLSCAPA